MKFIIRDDDLNFYSTPADIERWYADLFAESVPVGFSAIPFVMPASDVYPKNLPPVREEHPIHENKELLRYIQGNPLIEILQHGTTHETINAKFEYARRVPLEETRRGREELERAFGRHVRIFVPPHDWIGTSGVRSVEAAEMDVIRGRGAGLRNWIIRPIYLFRAVHMGLFKLWYLLQGRAVPAYPFILNFGKHRELCSYRLEDKDVFEGLRYVHRKKGIFVVVAHLHYYTPETKERLKALIEEARKLKAEFVLPSTVFYEA